MNDFWSQMHFSMKTSHLNLRYANHGNMLAYGGCHSGASGLFAGHLAEKQEMLYQPKPRPTAWNTDVQINS